jgi:hypothetical protein
LPTHRLAPSTVANDVAASLCLESTGRRSPLAARARLTSEIRDTVPLLATQRLAVDIGKPPTCPFSGSSKMLCFFPLARSMTAKRLLSFRLPS